MRQFLKFLFASCLGTLLALFAIIIFTVSAIGGLASAGSEPKPVQTNSVLHLDLKGAIPELTDNLEPTTFNFRPQTTLGLHDLIRTIQHAKTDDQIRGLYIDADVTTLGLASTRLLREAIKDFRDSGKFAIACAPYYSQGAYYLATAADSVFVEPQGIIDLRGPGAQVTYFKNLLDKIGVQMQVFYAGKFKSATEPLRRTDMSPENREQVRAFLDDIYTIMVDDLAESRNLSPATVREAVNEFTGIDLAESVRVGLIDGVRYRQEVMITLKKLTDREDADDPRLITPADYFAAKLETKKISGDHLAVLIAEGSIVNGDAKIATIADRTYVKLIDQLIDDESVKGIVLRINSGGGSSSASENIHHAIERFKATGRPVYVSMGNAAASGGYYIACNADTIVAEPTTLTGSIGVFSVVPNAKELMNRHLGITFDTVKTAEFSAGLTLVDDLSAAEKKLLQRRTDELYEIFLRRVANGRDLTVAEVDSIAQGRVWTGLAAQEIGLVDELGDLQVTLGLLAQRTGVDADRYEVYPKPKDPFLRLLEEFFGEENLPAEMALRRELGTLYTDYQELKEISDPKQGGQMRSTVRLEF